VFDDEDVVVTPSLIKATIERSLRQVFGNTGGAVPFEVLEVTQDAKAFLKVDRRSVE
jgi:hypothetical protein